LLGFIGGVVENLDFEPVVRVVHGADGFDKAVDHKLLIENRELNGDGWQLVETTGRRGVGVLAVFEIEVAERVAMDAINGQQDHDGEVGKQDGGVKGVPVVKVLEGSVGVLHGLEVMDQAIVGREGEALSLIHI